MRRNSSSMFKKIAIIIVIIAIVYIIIPPFNSEETSNHNDYENNYLLNNNVNHNVNTSSTTLNEEVSAKAREKYTKIIGENIDEVTVMVYIIGTDLESSNGAATDDINEMLYADKNDNINIVLQTGGCKRWQNSIISNANIERYTINSEGLFKLDCKINNGPMTNEETLTSFIRYSAENFPANRYMLILWDHGGGSAVGYGYDEKYPNNPSMAPDVISSALRNSGIKFDFVGFDACLMNNLETALALEPYADYLIGSEETEPACGWNYTGWIEELDANTSIPTIQLAKTIIDDYTYYSLKQVPTCEVTQSIIDLGELVSNIKEPLMTFSKATNNELNNENYQKIGIARSNTKEFSKSSKLDQVDLVDLALKFDVDGSKELKDAITSAVKYNKTANITDAYGLSAYFPFSSLTKVNEMVKIYENINIDEEYSSAVKSFASYAASGQIVTQNSNQYNNSLFDVLMDNDYYSSQDYSSDNIFDILEGANSYSEGYNYYDSFGDGYDYWFDYSNLDPMSSFFRKSNLVDVKTFKTEKEDGQNVIYLNDDEWNLISEVTLNMFVDDEDGFVDLGKDNTFDWSKKGGLVVDSDGTWLTLNDHLVAYYLVNDTYVSDNNYKVEGIIPANLNGQRVDLIVNFTNEHPEGIILGANRIYDTGIQDKGLIKIKDGDEIEFLFKFYSYDGKYIDEYAYGDNLIVNGDLKLVNKQIDNKYVYTYCFKDIYGNELYSKKSESK